MSVLRLKIGDQIVADVPANQKFMAVWNSPVDPSPSWYRTYSSMKYKIELFYNSEEMVSEYRLTPVKGAVVYSFDTWGEVIEGTRDFSKRLLFGDENRRQRGQHNITFIEGVPMYRAISGPPRAHLLYPLPPYWEYSE